MYSQEKGVEQIQLNKRKSDVGMITLPKVLRLSVLPALILSALAQPADAAALGPAALGPAAADPAAADPGGVTNFETDFMPMGDKVDVSRFEKANTVAPGKYLGDVLVNQAWRAHTDITFKLMPGVDQAQPCFDVPALTRYGIDLKKVYADTSHPGRKSIPADGQFCGPIGDYIPGAKADFDPSDLTLSLSVPQLYVSRDARGYVDPSQWSAGTNALLLNYNSNFYRNGGVGGNSTTGYVGLNATLDLGSWHLVHMGSLSSGNHQRTTYQNAATYIQHDIPSLKGQLQGGDVFTSGTFFDSVRLRGARFYSDTRMYPQSQQGFAPVIRGFAETNARVRVRQRGTVIYETTVAPGPFVIDDMYPTGYGGDFDVEITEADGRVRHMIVPFDSVPQLLRPGQSRWELAGGQVNQYNYKNTPFVLQGTYQHGVSNHVTVYGGLTMGTGYFSALGGTALNTPVGAFSFDVTEAHSHVPGSPSTDGASARLGYSKIIASTGTNFSMAAYRYSTSGFLGLNDYVTMRNNYARGGDPWAIPRSRNQLSVNISQKLGNSGGQIYLSGVARDYWNQRGRQVDFTAGYSNSWRSLTYSISAQRTRDTTQSILPVNPAFQDVIPGMPDAYNPTTQPTRRDTLIFATLSIPLGQSTHSPILSGQFTHSQQTGSTSQAVLTGNAGDHNQYSYNVSAGYSTGDTTFGAYGQYAGTKTNLSAGYSHSSGYNQYSAGASGSVVVHGGGVTFSQPTGDTVGLIYAPDAAGATVSGSQGLTVDSRGYAVVPYLQPYQNNVVTLDPKGSAANVELKATTVNVAPRAGTVSKLRYETSVGRALLIDAKLPDGNPLPFGADVFDEKGDSVGVVGQASRVFVQGLEKSGVLTVRWGDGADESCRLQVNLPPMVKGKRQDSYEKFVLPCSQGASSEVGAHQPAVSSPDEAADKTKALPSKKPVASAQSLSGGSEVIANDPMYRQVSDRYVNPRMAALTGGA
jgi:outer membrane usher protein